MQAQQLQVAIFQGGVAGPYSENFAILREQAEAAKKKNADLIVVPEVFFTGYSVGERFKTDALALDSPEMKAVGELAQKIGISICVGYSERAGDKVYNSLVFFDSNGKVLQNYRKNHLYCTYERLYFEPGTEIMKPFEFRGWKIGLLICFDVEYPESARALTVMGVNIILSVAANFSSFTTRVTTLQRAQENNIYLAYVNRVGKENTHQFNGDSVIVAPDGTEVARCNGTGPDLQIGTLNLQDPRWEQERKRNPYLEGRRPQLYTAITLPISKGEATLTKPTPKAQLVRFADDLLFSSQPSVDQLSNLTLLGVKSVINMRCTDETGFLHFEEQLMQEQGIHYAQIGVKTANDIDQAYTEKVLAKIEELPKPVLVHCAVGVQLTHSTISLTAAMLSCIRIAKENKASGADVLQWGSDLGYNFANQAGFYAFVNKYLPGS